MLRSILMSYPFVAFATRHLFSHYSRGPASDFLNSVDSRRFEALPVNARCVLENVDRVSFHGVTTTNSQKRKIQVDKRYNGIAYAAGDLAHWWWPFPADVPEVRWPAGVVRAETVAAFRAAFAPLGYMEWVSEELDTGLEKIALFANDQGFPLHAARQRNSGRWTSKLGEREDIDHDLRDLENEAYRTVVLIVQRQLIEAAIK